MAELPNVFRVESVQREAEGIATVWLAGDIRYQPGQFIMVWLPRLGEKPYAISYLEGGRFAITVKKRGAFSGALTALRPGQLVGIRGPYGRGFRVQEPPDTPAQMGPRGAIVAGSVGLATVALIKDRWPTMPLLFGARTAAEVHFTRRFPDMQVFTDDGSAGTRGFPTAALPGLLAQGKIDVVYTCGPEAMMVAVFRICEEHHVECQASLERYMKCGIGVCGQCVCDSLLVCKDGPVFPSAALRQMREFGHTALLKDGTRAPVDEFLRGRREPEAPRGKDAIVDDVA